jgi:hypothetical protein
MTQFCSNLACWQYEGICTHTSQDDIVAAHLFLLAKQNQSNSAFVSQLHLTFREEWNKKNGLVENIVSGLPSLYTHPAMVLPGLRLAAGLNFLVLTKQEEKLGLHFPPNQMIFDDQTKAEVVKVLERRREFLQQFCLSAPQTNEVGRSSALFCSLVHINPQRPLRLLELGCSAGLNLFCDRYSYPNLNYTGTEDVTINVKTDGPFCLTGPTSPLNIISRKGCDLNPLNLRADSEFFQSLSYIWPDQRSRVALFTAAATALRRRTDPLDIVKESAEIFLERELKETVPHTATVVMHSVFLQYPPAEVRERITQLIEQAGAEATPSTPLYWIRFEMDAILRATDEQSSSKFFLDVVTFTGGPGKREVLAELHPHAAIIRWLPATSM